MAKACWRVNVHDEWFFDEGLQWRLTLLLNKFWTRLEYQGERIPTCGLFFLGCWLLEYLLGLWGFFLYFVTFPRGLIILVLDFPSDAGEVFSKPIKCLTVCLCGRKDDWRCSWWVLCGICETHTCSIVWWSCWCCDAWNTWVGWFLGTRRHLWWQIPFHCSSSWWPCCVSRPIPWGHAVHWWSNRPWGRSLPPLTHWHWPHSSWCLLSNKVLKCSTILNKSINVTVQANHLIKFYHASSPHHIYLSSNMNPYDGKPITNSSTLLSPFCTQHSSNSPKSSSSSFSSFISIYLSSMCYDLVGD